MFRFIKGDARPPVARLHLILHVRCGILRIDARQIPWELLRPGHRLLRLIAHHRLLVRLVTNHRLWLFVGSNHTGDRHLATIPVPLHVLWHLHHVIGLLLLLLWRGAGGRAARIPSDINRWPVINSAARGTELLLLLLLIPGDALLIRWRPGRRHRIRSPARCVSGAARAACHGDDKFLVDAQHEHICLGDDFRDFLVRVSRAEGHHFTQLHAHIGHGPLGSVVEIEETRAVLQDDTGQDVDIVAQHVAE